MSRSGTAVGEWTPRFFLPAQRLHVEIDQSPASVDVSRPAAQLGGCDAELHAILDDEKAIEAAKRSIVLRLITSCAFGRRDHPRLS